MQYPGTEGASEIVKDISFTVDEGGITGIVGQVRFREKHGMLAVMGLLDGPRVRAVRADHGEGRRPHRGGISP